MKINKLIQHNKIIFIHILLNALYFNCFSQAAYVSGSHSVSKSSYSAGAGSDRLLVVMIGLSDESDVGYVTDITWGGQVFTKQSSNTNSGNRIEIWTMNESAISSATQPSDIVVNGTFGSANQLYSIATFENVDQSIQVSESVSVVGSDVNALTITPSIVPAAGDLVYYGALIDQPAASHAESADFTELHEQTVGDASIANAYKAVNSAGSLSPTATMSVSGVMIQIAIVLPLSVETFTATSSGNWSVGTTWGGACSSGCTPGVDYPDSDIKANIEGGVVVTIEDGTDAECYGLTLNSNRSGTSEVLVQGFATLEVQRDLEIWTESIVDETATSRVLLSGTNVLTVGNDIRLEAAESISANVNYVSGSSSDDLNSYTPGTGSDRMLVASITRESDSENLGDITDVKFGSTSLTFQQKTTRNDGLVTEIWTLDETGIVSESSPANFTITENTPLADNMSFNVITLADVNQSSPIGSISGKTSKTGGINKLQLDPLSVNGGDLLFYAASTRQVYSHTAPAGFTVTSDNTSSDMSLATGFKLITESGNEEPEVIWSDYIFNPTFTGITFKPNLGGGLYQHARINFSETGDLNVGSNILLSSNSNSAICKVDIRGDNLTIGGNIIEENVAGTGQYIHINNSTHINYNGTNDQLIQTELGSTYSNTLGQLTISGSGKKILANNLNINTQLSMDGTATFDDDGHILTYLANSTLEYSGNVSQITGDELTSSIYDLKIDNSNGVTLDKDITINGTVDFTNGQLFLGTYDVIAASITGYDENKYFVTNGSGYLQRDISASSTTDFPVGISSISLSNLVQLTPIDASTFQVRVDSVFDNSPTDEDKVVKAEWHINRTAGSSATTIRLNWRDDGDMTIGPNFLPNYYQGNIGYWTGSQWQDQAATSTLASSPDFYFESTGFTSFSAFIVGVGDDPIPQTFTSSSDGDWNIGTTWGGACSADCTAHIDYPEAADQVNIIAGTTVTIPAGLEAACNDLTVNSDRNTARARLLLTDATSKLNVTNDAAIHVASDINSGTIHRLNLNGGTLDVGGDLQIEAEEGINPVQLAAGSSSIDPDMLYDAGSESNRLLVVSVSGESVGPSTVGQITDIKYGNTSLTFRAGDNVTERLRAEIWTLSESDIAAESPATFTITWDDAPEQGEKFNAVIFYDVDQTTPISYTATKTDPTAVGTTLTLDPMDVNENDVCFYVAANRFLNNDHSTSSGFVEVSDQTTGEFSMATAYKAITTDGTEAPVATWVSQRPRTMTGIVISPTGTGIIQQSNLNVGGGSLKVAGNIDFSSNTTNAKANINLQGGTGTMTLGGNITESNKPGTGQQIQIDQSSILEYNGADNQTIQTLVGSTSITTLGSLILAGGKTKTLEGDLTIEDNLTMADSATFSNGGHTLTYASAPTLTYAGTTAQTTGDELPATLDELVINNTFGVTLNKDITVSSDITFTEGQLTLGANDVIASDDISDYDENKYFITNGAGYLQRDIAASTTVDFPVGISATSLSNLVQLTPADASTFQVRVDSVFDNGPADEDRVAKAEWHIDRMAGTAATTVRLNWRDDGDMTFGDDFMPIDQAQMGRWHGSGWEIKSATYSNTGNDHYFEASGFTLFSPFALGDGDQALPVDLLYFNAKYTLDKVEVHWTTATETNNEFFTVERSVNGIDYQALGHKAGAGTTFSEKDYSFIDFNPLPGISYYRLKQTDYDGQFEIFDPVKVQASTHDLITIYPNPVSGNVINIATIGLTSNQVFQVQINDLYGNVILNSGKSFEGDKKMSLRLPGNLIPGYYFLKLIGQNATTQFRFIKE